MLSKGRSVAPRSPQEGQGDQGHLRAAWFPEGEVLISNSTTPDWEPVMKAAWPS